MESSKHYTLTILASACGALAFTVASLWFLSVPALAFFFLDLKVACSRNDAFIRGLIFGVITGGASIWWAWGALPFLWLGYTSPWDGAYVMAIIWGLVSLFLGVAPALYGSVIYMLRNSPFQNVFLILLWPVAEWGRMWSFALFAAGENSLLGPHFSFAALGYTLADSPFFLSAAGHGGIFGLSVLLSVLGVLILCALRKNILTALALLCVTILLLQQTDTPAVTTPLAVGLVHTVRHDLPETPPLLSNVLRTEKTANVLVVPEDLFMLGTSSLATTIEQIKEKQPPMLVAFPYRETGAAGLYRTFAVLADQTGELARFQKQFLMPEGEYTPFLSRWIFLLIGDQRVQSYFTSVKLLQQGGSTVPLTYNGFSILGRLCSDIISPYVTHMTDYTTPSLIVNIGDQTWFNSSRLLHRRLVQIAKVRAVENRSFVAVANRGSPSYLIDPRGVVLTESTWDTEGVTYGVIK